MKKSIYTFPMAVMLFFSCSTTSPKPDCGNMICTQDFRMVQLSFKDSLGNKLVIKDYSATNKRTGESMTQNGEAVTQNSQGIYTVASDADVKNCLKRVT